ncbi:hypothetical protein PR202_ga28742 [Eleusine coracana subsp. coracana]|uniref:Dirigent protein n=1 Tax=Eleusine coracana subsp. coracana TaxID=191504 RepID=A0AAV5DK93_ELECO|nr:hypothetical protein PR202_ga28742 [Eleusine coracana subsp. coracana]
MATTSSSCPCPYTCENEIDLRLYLKQVVGGTDQNQFEIYRPKTGIFGTTVVNDWILVDAPVPNAKVIARAQGLHVLSDLASVGWFVSLNIAFQPDNRFNGSTLQVMGVLPPEGQWAIVGGTGELAMARGTIKHSALPPPPPGSTFGFRQLDIHALYPKNAAERMELF